uniref:NADH-ubiquinone oxidoreductase chain 6 n=1 Tax=[Candida] psychrophila TaxID=45577 RepID=A0A291F7Z4_9ASCO|nr:NADH dehydrogenase subunit 6 [[Candida] psychrophila]ATG28293.1 NADH dehydrogenase subunit 6 [[Candida] psychrophila]
MNTISGLSSLTAIGMLTPVQSMLCLMILFVSTAMCLYSQGFVLMGMTYVTMYVGAMAMLFLFMLSLLKMEYTPQGTMTPLVVTLLAMCLMPLDMTYETYGMVTQMENVTDELVVVGNQLYTEYAMLLILTGLMLMLSVMGAMSMTK